MTQKILRKTRNKFLYQAPPENLLPSKRIKKILSNAKIPHHRFRRQIFFYRQEKSLISTRYFDAMSTSRKQATFLVKIPDFSWHVGKEQFGKDVLKPNCPNLRNRLNQVISKNILSFLITANKKRKTSAEFYKNHFLLSREKKASRLQTNKVNFLATDQGKDALLLNPPLRPEFLNQGDKKSIEVIKDMFVTSGTTINSVCKLTTPKVAEQISLSNFFQFFSICWKEKNSFIILADFLKNHLFNNQWSCLFSVHDIDRRRDKSGDQFKNQYAELKKLAIMYGNLPRRALVRFMRRATYKGEKGGEVGLKFLSALERRLDVALKRVFFFPTIKAARQWIHQGKIMVNKQICTHNSYLLQPADFICIKKKYVGAWRKEWGNSFSTAAKESVSRRTNLLAKEIKNSQPFFPPVRRFLFPPLLMQKWDFWSKKWSSCTIERNGKNVHKWIPQQSCSEKPVLFSRPFFNSSFLTECVSFLPSWLSEQGCGRALKNSKEKSSSSTRDTTVFKEKDPVISLLYRPKTKFSQQLKSVSLALGKRRGKKGVQFLLASLFLKQQPTIVDGLYQLRWNKIFTKKKHIQLKQKHWQQSCMKPLHFECSYKHLTAIYLYPPQKLVWPTYINVLLIKKALI